MSLDVGPKGAPSVGDLLLHPVNVLFYNTDVNDDRWRLNG